MTTEHGRLDPKGYTVEQRHTLASAIAACVAPLASATPEHVSGLAQESFRALGAEFNCALRHERSRACSRAPLLQRLYVTAFERRWRSHETQSHCGCVASRRCVQHAFRFRSTPSRVQMRVRLRPIDQRYGFLVSSATPASASTVVIGELAVEAVMAGLAGEGETVTAGSRYAHLIRSEPL